MRINYTTFLNSMHEIYGMKNGEQSSEVTSRELFLSPPSFLPPGLPNCKPNVRYGFSSDSNIKEIREFDPTVTGADTGGMARLR